METHADAPLARRDPFPSGLQRAAALSGILAVILMIVSIALSGDDTPDFNAPVGEWTTYAQANEDNLRRSALALLFGVYAFLWFLGYLRGVLGAGEAPARGFTRISHVAFAGGIVGIIGLAFAIVSAAAAAGHPTDTPPEVLRGLAMLAGSGFGIGASGFATLMIASGLATLRLPVLPKWLGWLGLLGGIFFLLVLLNVLDEDYANGVFEIFYPLSFLALFIWTIGCSVSFLRRLGDRDTRPVQAT